MNMANHVEIRERVRRRRARIHASFPHPLPAHAFCVLCMFNVSSFLIAEFYLVERGLRHRLPGFSSLDRLVVLIAEFYF
jgi:hypothetical protein